MIKYYTRACNFYFGQTSIEKIKKKQSIPLHGNKLISFDTVEILTRKTKRKISIKKIKELKGKIKKKLLFDINQIKKKKRFKYLNFSNIPVLMGILNLPPDSFSDGGKYNKNKNGLTHGKKLIGAVVQGWVLCLDSQGNQIWENTYGNEEGAIFQSVKQTTDGGYILTGEGQLNGTTSILHVKTDPNGNIN